MQRIFREAFFRGQHLLWSEFEKVQPLSDNDFYLKTGGHWRK